MLRRVLPVLFLIAVHAPTAELAVAQERPEAAEQADAQASDGLLTPEEFQDLMIDLKAWMAGSAEHGAIEKYARQTWKLAVASFGQDAREVIEVEYLITDAVIRQGHYDEALELARTVASRANRLLETDDELLWQSLNQLIQAHTQSGDAAEAQSLATNVLAEAEQRLGESHYLTIGTRLQLARAARSLGQSDVAEAHFARIAEQTAGQADPRMTQLRATALGELGYMQAAHGKLQEALVSLDASIADYLTIYSVLKHPDLQPDILEASAVKAKVLWALDRYDETDAFVQPILARVEEVYGRSSSRWAVFASIRSLALYDEDKPEDVRQAIDLMREVEAIWAAERSPSDADLVEARDMLGFMLARNDRPGEGLDMFSRTLEGGALPRGDYYLYALALAAKEGVWDATRAGNSVLDYLQTIQGFGAARAQAQLNERLLAGTGEAASILRDLSDNQAAVHDYQQRLSAVMGLPLEARDEAEERTLRTELGALQDAVSAIRQRIDTEFPSLAAVSGQGSLSKEEIQSHLGDDEALVILETGALDGQPMAMVITRDDAMWYSISATASQMQQAVEAIRTSVELTLGVRSAAPKHKRQAAGAFPVEFAHGLYEVLIAPGAELLEGKKHLYFDLRGAMTALPPQLLVVAPPAGDDVPTDWLIRHYSVTVLPSISSLRTAALAGAASPSHSILAFADPVFDVAQAAPATLRSALAPLPETADEAGSVVAAFGAPQSAARLGVDASEAALKAASLDDYRVLYFATHGLVAGDIAGTDGAPLSEPALALTAGGGEDGFLTASEISQMRLSADWVVLSACNTAVGETPGAEPLSGLARAFMYAGARALMVSHWPVESHSAVYLMTELFSLRAQHPQMRGAEAQRQAILSILDGGGRPEWSHPAYWAPFILVGVPDRG
ncbi:CHAT domain-containing tetratricopeptide repeat protein [Oricola sp.]|uniref:CHAT domain-containing protein n=1 Tax=Oricola sp. TaxID=1979950 RepID=UPI0025F8928A|nr:CHAT domain-containing tetratricopeptide repeat protein [Oricola sp.]MCI5074417.1 CHAT domain-containing protein [Oricola sp.]